MFKFELSATQVNYFWVYRNKNMSLRIRHQISAVIFSKLLQRGAS